MCHKPVLFQGKCNVSVVSEVSKGLKSKENVKPKGKGIHCAI